ncbi:hypothetical protein, partial [Mesorhizobium sp. M2A.F.Ca.ET.029.05.1.1]|uniref:hypothetical protein n=1 Tax=Mesorhizobium sp. M2A.F.Ca.ET.029.05.1.1 TaxID=2496658 RepID=UPI001AECDA13
MIAVNPLDDHPELHFRLRIGAIEVEKFPCGFRQALEARNKGDDRADRRLPADHKIAANDQDHQGPRRVGYIQQRLQPEFQQIEFDAGAEDRAYGAKGGSALRRVAGEGIDCLVAKLSDQRDLPFHE